MSPSATRSVFSRRMCVDDASSPHSFPECGTPRPNENTRAPPAMAELRRSSRFTTRVPEDALLGARVILHGVVAIHVVLREVEHRGRVEREAGSGLELVAREL